MIWTHFYDLLVKLLIIVIMVVTMLALPEADLHPALVIGLMAVIYCLLYFPLFRTLGSYLYCRFSLKMKLSFLQAAKLNPALSPVFHGSLRWLPLESVKEESPENKFAVALALCNEWLDDNRNQQKEWVRKFKGSSSKTKILSVTMWMLMVYFFVAGFANLPPASYLATGIGYLFDTTSYYPILNALILIALTAIIFTRLDKNIN